MAEGDLTLSLRIDPVGGDVADGVPRAQIDAVRAELNAAVGRGLVLLVHGFNNTLEDATGSYDGFFRVQRELAQIPDARALADNRVFVRVLWPGDAKWGVLSPLYYPRSVTAGVLCAERFGAALRALAAGRAEPLDVWIVGHSMGCRIALEILRWITQTPSLRVSRLVLMAGAVPTYRLEATAQKPGSLRKAYDDTLGARAGACRSLYSSWDGVLAGAFPYGQSLAEGDEGFTPVALGHEYWQAGVPLAGHTQGEVHGAGHSDYWGGEKKTHEIALRAQKQVAEFLGFQSSAARDTVEREAAGRQTVEARETASRGT